MSYAKLKIDHYEWRPYIKLQAQICVILQERESTNNKYAIDIKQKIIDCCNNISGKEL